MKILVPCSTIDLKYKLGCTPSWWQLIKAFHELGHEIIVTPFLGDPVESLWWRTYPNPCSFESRVYNKYLEFKRRSIGLAGRSGRDESLFIDLTEKIVHDKWASHIMSILEKEKDIDAIMFMNLPLNSLKGIPDQIHKQYAIPVAYVDGDMPTILPKYAYGRGFKINYYKNADLSEYDVVFTNSKGSIPDLIGYGARKVAPLYYAVDPHLFSPIPLEKTIDVSFFGYGSEYRDEWMEKMISVPSVNLPLVKFCIGGKGFSIDLGKAIQVGDMSYSAFRTFCCSSKLCLNITRWSHTSVYASSTARPFELAGFGSCVVSQPYSGITEWFVPGKEIILLDESDDVCEVYTTLLEDDEQREKIGNAARARVVKDHTFSNRANLVLQNIKDVK